MPLPLLVVLISAGAAAAGSLESSDTTPDTSSSEAAVECVLPDGDAADTTEPAETTEVVETTEPAEQEPADAFFDGFCVRAQEVAALGPFLTETLTRDGSEQFRAGMCDPSFRPPDRDQSNINWMTFIRDTAQTDTETAEAWLDAGVLSGFDDDDEAIEVDEDVLTELVDIEMAFLDEFEANRDEWCADLLETVEATEP
jgi:hypothetical protein